MIVYWIQIISDNHFIWSSTFYGVGEVFCLRYMSTSMLNRLVMLSITLACALSGVLKYNGAKRANASQKPLHLLAIKLTNHFHCAAPCLVRIRRSVVKRLCNFGRGHRTANVAVRLAPLTVAVAVVVEEASYHHETITLTFFLLCQPCGNHVWC